ncbi:MULTISPECIES: hypothetical protein [unclassified Thiobacillus]|uniref:hypothetical protein n=1 Tax=unclassified Thiobacillus TaxID=2646513 RepID=UPI000AABCF33|nr:MULTISPECIES: hypothetical protein [unclassified Thiobacillus]MBD3813243.1 hypothetical protein [Betaproteobacteria bacterium]MBC2729681.1 hypothetical protein [Thiobacillus sp.]MBC2738416.1 hypothetical protein [Thiobacillus sp.]MBC2761304.1 hypothetical protein [Thiobacillus sp.]TXH74308.1 MAG: hypothetical protein E6Q82_11005 [Thiobacillus sp.]
MLKLYLRHAAPWARASFLGLTAASAWLVALPAAQAAETPPSPPAVSNPFAHYRAWREDALQDWRQANDRVGEIGGWRTYLRESQQTGEAPDQTGQAHHAH